MRVSIIIPIYNVTDYIERCLRSVIAQTYNGELECILVDDCSTDDSMKKCNEIVESYEGPVEFHILHHEHNRGLSSARNTGTDFCTGEYLFYLDSDDELTPDAISLLVAETDKYPGIDIVQGYTTSVPDSNFYHTERYQKDKYFNTNERIRLENYRVRYYLPCNACNKLIKTDFIRKNNLRFCDGIIHEDQHWMYFACKQMDSMVFVFLPTYIHYKTPGSIMMSNIQGVSPRSRDGWLKIIEDVLDNLDDTYRNNQLVRYCYELIIRPMYNNPKGRKLLLRFCSEFFHVGYFYLSILLLTAYVTSPFYRFRYRICTELLRLSDKLYDENLLILKNKIR